MIKNIFKIILSCSFIFYSLNGFCNELMPSKVKHSLEQTTLWMQSLLEQQKESLAIHFFSIDDQIYRSFIERRLLPKNKELLNTVGLSVVFDEHAKKNGKKTPTCFILFNPKFEQQLQEQFFSKTNDIQKMSVFLIAHELGHCFSYYFPTQKAPENIIEEEKQRWQETISDAFAIALTTLALNDGSIYKEIHNSRKMFYNENGQSSSHNTSKTIENIFSDVGFPRFSPPYSMRLIWEQIEPFRNKHFFDR